MPLPSVNRMSFLHLIFYSFKDPLPRLSSGTLSSIFSCKTLILVTLLIMILSLWLSQGKTWVQFLCGGVPSSTFYKYLTELVLNKYMLNECLSRRPKCSPGSYHNGFECKVMVNNERKEGAGWGGVILLEVKGISSCITQCSWPLPEGRHPNVRCRTLNIESKS